MWDTIYRCALTTYLKQIVFKRLQVGPGRSRLLSGSQEVLTSPDLNSHLSPLLSHECVNLSWTILSMAGKSPNPRLLSCQNRGIQAWKGTFMEDLPGLSQSLPLSATRLDKQAPSGEMLSPRSHNCQCGPVCNLSSTSLCSKPSIPSTQRASFLKRDD